MKPDYPATFCACSLEHRAWNGYGTCLECGGAYEAKGEMAAIVVEKREEDPACPLN